MALPRSHGTHLGHGSPGQGGRPSSLEHPYAQACHARTRSYGIHTTKPSIALFYYYFLHIAAAPRGTANQHTPPRRPGERDPRERSRQGPARRLRGTRGVFSRRFFSTAVRGTFLALTVSSRFLRQKGAINRSFGEERRGGRDGTGRGCGRPLRGGSRFCSLQPCAACPRRGLGPS